MEKEVLRIAVVLGEMGTGGIERVVMNYYRHLDHSRVQFDFFVHEDSKNILNNEIEALGGTITLIPKYSHIVAYCNRLEKEFRERQYKIVHIHLNTMSLFAQFAAWKAGVPIRITHNHSTAGKGEIKRNAMKYVLRLFSNCFVTDRCACSKYAAEWMWGKKKLADGEITIWPNAIELEKFAYNEEHRNRIRHKYGIDDDKFVIGHIGRFMPQKNHEFLIDVFNEVQKRRNDAVLLLVGEGPLKESIQNKVVHLGIEKKVIFAGTTNEPWAYYDAFDAFVLPSLYEGLPVVGVEAQATGLPCYFADTITREVEIGNVEFIQDDSDKWVSALEKAVAKNDRASASDTVKQHGFDIADAGLKLTDWYIKLSEPHFSSMERVC